MYSIPVWFFSLWGLQLHAVLPCTSAMPTSALLAEHTPFPAICLGSTSHSPLFPGYRGDAERNPAPVPRLTIGINKLRFRLASSARRGLFSSGVLHFHTLGKHLSIVFEKHKRFSIMGFMFNMGNDFPSLRIAIKMFRQN